MIDDNRTGFQYTYTVPTERERKEIESIRQGYEVNTAVRSKLDNLRALDRKAKAAPKAIAISLGIIYTSVFGLGLSMVMAWSLTAFGVLVSIVGVLGMIINYPIYKKIKNKFKQKYGEQIIKLSDELLQEKVTK